MTTRIDVIAFDADDTLWHNEVFYSAAQKRLGEILSAYRGDDGVQDELYQTEVGNLPLYGYGLKSFTLSMIETAIRLSEGRIDGHDVQKIVDLAKEMRRAPIQLLDHVAEVIPALAGSYPLMLITKGDLFDQESKIARSGLAGHFTYTEIVSEKAPDVYRSLWAKHQIDPRRVLMVGNSLRSDVLPVVSLGARAVHIPYHITWAHEAVPAGDNGTGDYYELEHIGLLPQLVEQLSRQEAGAPSGAVCFSGDRDIEDTKEEN